MTIDTQAERDLLHISLEVLTRDERQRLRDNVAFIRHAQTQWNAEGRLQGSSNGSGTNLTELGKQAMVAVGQQLAQEFAQANLVVASPLSRAQESAHLIIQQYPKPPEIMILPQLQEFGFGLWEGLSIQHDLINGQWSKQHEQLWTKNPFASFLLGIPPNAESMIDFAQRTSDVLHQLATISEASPIITVTHGMTARMMRFLVGISQTHEGSVNFKQLLDTGEQFFFDQGKFVSIPNGYIEPQHLGLG